MARMYRKSEWEVGSQPAIAVTPERSLPPPGPSPARALQEMLEQRTTVETEAARWSRRRSLAFIVAAAASLWLALLAMVHGIVAAIA